MRINKLNIERWQEQLQTGMISLGLLGSLQDILRDLEDFAKRELDEQDAWNCMECKKTYVHKNNRCTCKHGTDS